MYKDLKGYFPKTWGKILSEELGCEYRNFAQGGWDNYSILQSFCENIAEIKKNDIVFVGWAPEPRIRLTDKNGVWRSFNVMIQNDWGDLSGDDFRESHFAFWSKLGLPITDETEIVLVYFDLIEDLRDENDRQLRS